MSPSYQQQGGISGYRDEESESLNASSSPSNALHSNDNNNNSSWKRWTAGAALVALLGYTAINGTSNNLPSADGADSLLGKGHHHHPNAKAGKGVKKHAMTEAEKNAELFDESREFRFAC
mmetsp:Transcript_23013/g.43507  ORF Transcript_23013/g.43507 Transcript_23013/m.43507 type:complete len:120 (+) Transcript_23013:338-697(+)